MDYVRRSSPFQKLLPMDRSTCSKSKSRRPRQGKMDLCMWRRALYGYVEVTEGAAAILEQRLRQMRKRSSPIPQCWFADWRSRFPSLFSITTVATNEQSSSHNTSFLQPGNQGSTSSSSNSKIPGRAGPGKSVQQSRDTLSKQNWSAGGKSKIGYQMPSTPDLYVLTCANEARDTVKLTHVALSRQNISNDTDLAFALRAHWSWLNKMWYSFFRFKGLTSIEFLKFTRTLIDLLIFKVVLLSLQSHLRVALCSFNTTSQVLRVRKT